MEFFQKKKDHVFVKSSPVVRPTFFFPSHMHTCLFFHIGPFSYIISYVYIGFLSCTILHVQEEKAFVCEVVVCGEAYTLAYTFGGQIAQPLLLLHCVAGCCSVLQ